MEKRLGLVVMWATIMLILAGCTTTTTPTPAPVKAPAATPTAALPASTPTSVAPAAAPTPTVAAAAATPEPTKPPATPTVAAATPEPTKPAATPTVAAPASTPTVAALAASPTPTKPEGAAGDPVAGKAVFDSNCTACHPRGQQGAGPSLVGAAGRMGGEAGVRNKIRYGSGIMPPYPDNSINDKQIADLVAYIATLK